MSKILVSVIIPVHNGEDHLPGAIETVSNQSRKPDEIIVVDDSSTDDTPNVARKFSEIRYFRNEEKRGPACARNLGIKKARGDVIAFLDVDDFWPPENLEIQLGVLVSEPEAGIVQGLIQDVRLAGRAQDSNLPDLVTLSSPYQFVNLGSAIFRGEVFATVGLFDESLTFNEDTDWFFRAWEQGVKKVVHNKISLFYRMHESNMTRQQNLTHFGLPGILKKHLERKEFWAPKKGNEESLAEFIGGFPDRSAYLNREETV